LLVWQNNQQCGLHSDLYRVMNHIHTDSDICSYTTAEMTLHYMQLMRPLWWGKMPKNVCV